MAAGSIMGAILIGLFRGIYRLFVVILVLIIGTTAVLLIAWIPKKIQGVRISIWAATIISRILLKVLHIQVKCFNTDRLRQHEGFIFPNHVSFLDVLMVTHITPVRFLSKAALRYWPLIGWIASGIGTVFVNRSDKSSREAARKTLSTINSFPPIVLFPEGGIFSPAAALNPFRYGAFEIAQAGQVPYLPCVLIYEPLDIAFWADEPILTALWRFATYDGIIHAHMHVLRLVQPTADDDPHQLALETHGAMDAVLRYGGHEADVLQSGL